ncbi:MAG: 50S ribosomal protein L18 [Dehalococcoidia bacterium]|nr:MAG: 50S ribosomal protein L18 [Dehalococcoidia bacterium]
MMSKATPRAARLRRHNRVRAKVTGTSSRPRLCVFRSLNNVYAQVIDDSLGNTLTCASTLDPDIKDKAAGKAKKEKAELVGSLLAERALDKGITQVVFDRGGYKYHGRVKALAEAARKAGLKF